MLAYAPRTVARSGSPRTLFLVAAGHAVALGLVLTARSDLAQRAIFDPTDVIFVPTKLPPPPPPPPSTEPAPPRQSIQSTIDTPPVVVPTPAPPAQPLADGPAVTHADPLVGTAPEPQPPIIVADPVPAPVRTAARFATPADLVRPPYPASRQQSGDVAQLRLTLAIDPRGRVTAVSPVGRADPVFLDAARRHILRHWRYRPAREGDVAIASTVTITLRFELED